MEKLVFLLQIVLAYISREIQFILLNASKMSRFRGMVSWKFHAMYICNVWAGPAQEFHRAVGIWDGWVSLGGSRNLDQDLYPKW